jgi:hypothetical protein
VLFDDLPFGLNTFVVDWSKSFKSMWLSWLIFGWHYEFIVHFLGRTWTFHNLSVPVDDIPYQSNTFMVDWSKSNHKLVFGCQSLWVESTLFGENMNLSKSFIATWWHPLSIQHIYGWLIQIIQNHVIKLVDFLMPITMSWEYTFWGEHEPSKIF